jgi:hypothetical protein
MHPASWRWGAVLAFALFAPVGLPAGGVDRRNAEVRRRSPADPLVLGSAVPLCGAPDPDAPQLRLIAAGEPLQVLRAWASALGEQWLQVKLPDAALVEGPARGWIRLT